MRRKSYAALSWLTGALLLALWWAITRLGWVDPVTLPSPETFLGTLTDFDITIKMGAGAFVCGEETAILASIHMRSPHRVSKYGVSIESLEGTGVVALRRAIQKAGIIVIDEVGKMELFSAQFQQAVLDAVESGKPVLGTIMLVSHPWADKLKQQPRVRVFSITEANRSQVKQELVKLLEDLIERPGLS